MVEYPEDMAPKVPQPLSNREKLYWTAIEFIGKDAEPDDVVDDRFACMITVNKIHYARFGYYITPKHHASTYWGYAALKESETFKEISLDEIEKGDIVIAPTGYGGKNGISNGHICIALSKTLLASNDSSDGIFRPNYSLDTFLARYRDMGGYLVKAYRKI